MENTWPAAGREVQFSLNMKRMQVRWTYALRHCLWVGNQNKQGDRGFATQDLHMLAFIIPFAWTLFSFNPTNPWFICFTVKTFVVAGYEGYELYNTKYEALYDTYRLHVHKSFHNLHITDGIIIAYRKPSSDENERERPTLSDTVCLIRWLCESHW